MPGDAVTVSADRLLGLFQVDVTKTVADCGTLTLSLASDTKGTPFGPAGANNMMSLDSSYTLTIPTHRALNATSFYVKAVTPGNKIAYQKVTVTITECGSEVLTSNFPLYWNITTPYQSGLA